MRDQLNKVNEFMEVFKRSIKTSPTLIPQEAAAMRYKLMNEENEEYAVAVKNGDLVEIADALGDMLYILCGTMIEHGMQDKIEEVFDEIHRSNMTKLDYDGKPILRDDGKILKGHAYEKPNINQILKK
jgi:predicted HAD superfamily Cof-like phosphohydrolase